MIFERAPVAEKKPKKIEIHGDIREDSWYWLRETDHPEVHQYLAAENQYCNLFFADCSRLKAEVYNELRSKIAENDRSVPVREGCYWYFSNIKRGQQYPVFYRSKDPEGRDAEILLDQNKLAAGQGFCDLAYCVNSPDHSRLAYAVDFEGNESYTLYIFDLKAGKFLGSPIAGVSDSFEWCNNSRAFFYTKLDSNFRPRQVWHHDPDLDDSADSLAYEEEDERLFISLDKSENNASIYVCIDGNNMNEWYFIDADHPKNGLKLIQKREDEHEYEVSERGTDFFIKTNWKAKNYKIVRTTKENPGRENWRDFFSGKDERLVEDFILFRDYMVICEKKGCVQGVTVFDFKKERFIPVALNDQEQFFDLSPVEQREFETDEFYFCLQSLHRPPEIRVYSFLTGEIRILKKYQIPDPAHKDQNYHSELLFTKKKDGGPAIPVSLVYRRDLKPGPGTPLVLFAYGAYGCSAEADYRYSILPLLDRGFIYAQAHVRGGMDLGRDWYEEGKLLHKRNTFRDYLQVVEFLIDEGYTGKGDILATSGSAGGLILGYLANEAGNYFAGILAQVPFVDVLTTMLDRDLPLTTSEYNEWGNPEDQAYYEYIKGYSPYDNIRKQAYPAIFATAGLSDMRVPYWEPAKWIAKIREHNTADQPVLLRTQMDSGHGGASGRYDALHEVAEELIWILKIFGKHHHLNSAESC